MKFKFLATKILSKDLVFRGGIFVVAMFWFEQNHSTFDVRNCQDGISIKFANTKKNLNYKTNEG